MEPKIEWLGHDSFRLTGEKVVYIDPYEIQGGPTADIILITHDHFDHFVPADIAKVKGPNTVVVVPEQLAGKVQGKVKVVKRGDKLTVEGIPIEVVPAYNVKEERQKFHPNQYGGVGYIVTLSGKRIYHCGDTDKIPEMANIKCDIMLVPVSGIYVMTADEAADAVNTIRPALAIPMHWDSICGSWEDANAFKKKCTVPVEILGKTK